MVCLFVFTPPDSFTFSRNNYVCLCLSIHVSILTKGGFAIKKWNYHQPLPGGQSISRVFAPVLWDSSLWGGRKEGRIFSYRQKNIFKGLFVVPGPLHGPHIMFLLNYPRYFALFLSSWSFAEFPSMRLQSRKHCRRSFFKQIQGDGHC